MRAGAALYACQGSAALDQCREPNEGQVQQTARGYGARRQPVNYRHVDSRPAFSLFVRSGD